MKFELDLSLCKIKEKEFCKAKYFKKFQAENKILHSGNEDMTAWVNYPKTQKKCLVNIKKIAKDISAKADVLIVLGIGGSYLGALAGLTALNKKSKTKVEFAGINFSYEELENVFEKYKKSEVFVNVISKSGTTTETMIAFEYAVKFLKNKYKDEFKKHLLVTTDANKGYLRNYANQNDILSLEVPDGIGGRYSVLSNVGLLPFAVGGVDIDALYKGAILAQKELSQDSADNIAYRYALTRYLLGKNGKKVEVLSSFYPRLAKIGAWWTQLFAESEGKQGKGLFVTNLNFSTDLHSVGQFIQQGTPLLFETFLSCSNVAKDKKLTGIAKENPIKYLEGKTIEDVNKAAEKGTIEAHSNANVPIVKITLSEIDEEHIGYLFYFFCFSCAISGKFLGINPFDQPGVEDYKKNMKKNLLNN